MGSLLEKPLILITGHYGAGKTSFALSLAEKRIGEGISPVLIDLDTVNPYFRSYDFRAELEAEGIRVEGPVYAGTNLDIPALPPSIGGLIERASATAPVILDLGGDDAGAAVLGRYKPELAAARAGGKLAVLHVVNFCRALTPDAAAAKTEAREIAAACGYLPDGVVNSTNLGPETTPETILGSLPQADALAEKLDIPVAATALDASLWETLPPECRASIPAPFVLTRRVRLPWEEK